MRFLSQSLSWGSRPAFTRTELLVILAMLSLLLLVLRPASGFDADTSEHLVCLNNVRQIMGAMAMYAAENDDRLPHPSWGTISGGSDAGPDNWCYATRLPTGQYIPSATGKSGPDAHTNQLPWYRAGQLARYLESQRVLVCPTDEREARSTTRAWYIARAEKLSSYSMNGTVGGYTGPRSGRLGNGGTDKSSDYFPADILLWETDESVAFYFNDAANSPETQGEGLTRRHARSNGEGMGVVGRAGGGADFVKSGAFYKLQQGASRPNDLLCGPGYQ